MRGILNVYKERGYTSHDVVAKLRGICGMKKIGHTGTLDPDAAGVLPVCLGSATKICDLLTDRDKTYEAVLLLGVRTDTLDCTGEILEEKDPAFVASVVTKEDVRRTLAAFTGVIRQIPPMYSARKVGGRKLYELARAGVEVERRAREVTVYAIEILAIDLPRVKMRIRCSKGTYIRSLCDDIGTALGCGGCMESLLRTEAAGLRIGDAHTLAEIEMQKQAGLLEEWLVPVDAFFCDLPACQVLPESEKILVNGGSLTPAALRHFAEDAAAGTILPDGRRVRIYDAQGDFKAVYGYDEEKRLFRPVKMFL